MKSLFQKPRLKSQTGRNAFDRSSGKQFSVPFGALVPCFCARVNPNDYIELGVENQLICEPLIKPAFMRLKEHIDYYFVPYSQLWMPFENFVLGQDSYFSQSVRDSQNASIPSSVPYFTGTFVYDVLRELKNHNDAHGYNQYYGAMRLLDLLKYGNTYGLATEPIEGLPSFNRLGNMNFFGLLAYQKVYYDFYRNPLYEYNRTESYNIDDLMGGLYGPTLNEQYTPTARDLSFFEMHYRWCKKDYFMDVRPYVLPKSTEIGYSGLVTNFATVGDNYFSVPGSDMLGTSQAAANRRGTQVITTGETGNAQSGSSVRVPSVVASTAGSSTNTGQISVTGIRLAFAVDRLLRRQREAGAVFDRQMLAQYGIVPFDERHGKCYFIGGQTNRLFASDTTNTSATGEGLGSLGGQLNVYSPSRKTFKYHAKEHGIVIGIYSTSMDNTYPSFLQDRGNLSLQRFDWFNPAFDRLGLQAIFKRELSLLNDQGYDSTIDEFDPSDFLGENDSILGYVRRYADYKTGIHTAHSLFASSKFSADDAAWVAKYHPTGNGVYEPQTSPLSLATLTFNPATFNEVIGVKYDGDWNTDHFKVNHFTHFKCVSNMDVIGEDF